MTGMDLVKEVLSLRADLPIIINTGYSEQINEEIAEGVGISAYFKKPVDDTDLLAKVDELLT